MDDEPSGGGLPLFPLVIVVILAGLLLGGVLAHFFGGSNGAPKSVPTAMAVAPLPVESPPAATPPVLATSTPTLAPRPTASPTVMPSATPSVMPSIPPTPRVRPTPKRVASVATHVTPAHAPSATPAAPSTATPIPVAHLPAAPKAMPAASVAAAPKPVAEAPGDDRAAAIVRSYLNALARGDRATAAGYLAHGTPSEVFMDTSARIESIRSANLGTEYKVTADVQTNNGEYYVTFTLAPGPAGLQITDHYAIKPQ